MEKGVIIPDNAKEFSAEKPKAGFVEYIRTNKLKSIAILTAAVSAWYIVSAAESFVSKNEELGSVQLLDGAALSAFAGGMFLVERFIRRRNKASAIASQSQQINLKD